MKKSKILLLTTAFIFFIFQFTKTEAVERIILDQNAIKNLQIQTVLVEEKEFENIVFAIGEIEEIPQNQSAVSSRIAGRIVGLEAFEGDSVEKDQLIGLLESRQIGNNPTKIALKAPRKGVIVKSNICLGKPVEPEETLMLLSDRSQVWAKAQIPQKISALIKEETPARLRIAGLSNQWINAKMERWDINANPTIGTLPGIFTLENPENHFVPGQRVEFSIITQRRQSVLAVPVESIQGNSSKPSVFVTDFELPNTFLRVPVVLGEKNDRFVEVLEGLFPGDEVVTKGAYMLGFANPNSGISLKEALDAAHGHEHNEDGSEKTENQKATTSKNPEKEIENHHDHHHAWEEVNLYWVFYSVLMTLLSVVLGTQLWKKTRFNFEE